MKSRAGSAGNDVLQCRIVDKADYLKPSPEDPVRNQNTGKQDHSRKVHKLWRNHGDVESP
jgi:hypothetical protein